MRTCTRCSSLPTHLVIVDDPRGMAGVPYCSHHALKVATEALVEGRDLQVMDITRFLMTTPVAGADTSPPYED
jgi:hypothetical protein